jgi:hypothetical protein
MPILILVALLWLGLALLATDSWREMRCKRRSIGDEEPDLAEFAEEETTRAALRAAGWYLFFFGIGLLLFRDSFRPLLWVGLALVVAGEVTFLAEAVRGRRERRRMLGERE